MIASWLPGWFIHFFGIDDGTSQQYLFWSGLGSDLGEVALLGGLVQIYRSNRCHVDGCHRIGRHHIQHYRVCRIHHPGVPDKVTAEHIEKVHSDSSV